MDSGGRFLRALVVPEGTASSGSPAGRTRKGVLTSSCGIRWVGCLFYGAVATWPGVPIHGHPYQLMAIEFHVFCVSIGFVAAIACSPHGLEEGRIFLFPSGTVVELTRSLSFVLGSDMQLNSMMRGILTKRRELCRAPWALPMNSMLW